MKRLVTILALLVAVQGWGQTVSNVWICPTNGGLEVASNFSLGHIPTNFNEALVFDGVVGSNTSCYLSIGGERCNGIFFQNGYTSSVTANQGGASAMIISNKIIGASAAKFLPGVTIGAYNSSVIYVGTNWTPFQITSPQFQMGVLHLKAPNNSTVDVTQAFYGANSNSTTYTGVGVSGINCLFICTNLNLTGKTTLAQVSLNESYSSVVSYGSTLQISNCILPNSEFQEYQSTTGTNAVQIVDCTLGEFFTQYDPSPFYFNNTNSLYSFIRSSYTDSTTRVPCTITGKLFATNFSGAFQSGGYLTPSAESISKSSVTFNYSRGMNTLKTGLAITFSNGSYALTSAAVLTGSLAIANASTLSTAGLQLTSTLTTNSGTLIASNSTILVDQSLINAGSGVFSQMTSTVQFGTSTNTATCNVTNFYNVLCNTAGKSIVLTNAATKVLGTFSSTGAAASNVTWTGGSTLTLSNKAYLYFTSPFIGFAGKDVEVWDAASGTNQLGKGDYFPR